MKVVRFFFTKKVGKLTTFFFFVSSWFVSEVTSKRIVAAFFLPSFVFSFFFRFFCFSRQGNFSVKKKCSLFFLFCDQDNPERFQRSFNSVIVFSFTSSAAKGPSTFFLFFFSSRSCYFPLLFKYSVK